MHKQVQEYASTNQVLLHLYAKTASTDEANMEEVSDEEEQQKTNKFSTN